VSWRAERGSAALMLLLAGLLASSTGLVMVTAATDVAASSARARTAAEAAALAAVGTSPLAGGSGDPLTEARRAADANGALLLDCCGAVPLEAHAQAGVAPATRLVRAVLPQVRSHARAGLRPPEHVLAWGGSGALQRPVDGILTSGFGWRVHPITGQRRFHAGVDLAVPTGTPVRAAAHGVVTAAGWRGGYGLAVVIDHGAGLTTLYAHLSEIGVPPGAHVTAGQVIGAVGSTGASTGPHLHFEVRVHGAPRDPLGSW
jgi:murein DD-endopeptidase MepM/ murein hydrolase activator NlpD